MALAAIINASLCENDITLRDEEKTLAFTGSHTITIIYGASHEDTIQVIYHHRRQQPTPLREWSAVDVSHGYGHC